MNIHKYILFALFLLFSCTDKTTQPLELLWAFEYLDFPSTLSLVGNAPTPIRDKQVALTIDGNLVLLDTDNGDMKWSRKLGENVEIRSLNVLNDDSRIYIKFDDTKNVRAYNISDGEIDWDKNFNDLFDELTNDYLFEGKLYLINDEPIITIAQVNGEFVKTLQLDRYFARSILVDGDKVIAGQGWQADGANKASGRIVAYSENTNELLWSYSTSAGGGGYIFSPLLLSNGMVIAGTSLGDGETVGLDLNNGDVVWRKNGLHAWSITNSDSSVFVNDGGSIIALDLKTGRELWSTDLDSGFGQDNIAYFDNKVFHSHWRTLFVLDASNGEIVHTQQGTPDGSPPSNLTIIGDKLLIHSDAYLYCYEITI